MIFKWFYYSIIKNWKGGLWHIICHILIMEQEFLVGTYTQNGIYKLSFNNGTFYNKLSDNTFENCSYLCKNKSFFF